MAEQDIIQNMILQLGQSQDERMPEALGVHFADVDERTTEDLLLFTKQFAKTVRYYRDDIVGAKGDWTKFFSYDETTVKTLLANKDASTASHLALFLSFIELFRKPQEVLNRFTGRHLDFYYRDVLRLSKKAAQPDKAHVLLELKKQASATSIATENIFSAGKDASGIELIYTPTAETVINTAKVDSLRSLFVDTSGHGTVRYAPVANSSDGLGAALAADEPKWLGFGSAELPAAEIGFAIASPVLRMDEGTRKVIVTLTLNNVDTAKLNTTALGGAFDVYVTGEKTWLGPYTVSPTLSDEGVMQFDFTVPDTEKAILDYDAEIHGYAYTATAPIVQVLLKSDAAEIGYNDFKGVTVQKALVSVEVSNVTSLSLESDGGVLDPKKAFQPFGPLPTKGSRFMIGCDEALSKKLSELAIKVQWKDAPADFATRYTSYLTSVSNGYFTASVAFEDGGSWENSSLGVALFETSDASAEHTFTFTPGSSSVSPAISTGMSVYALSSSGSSWAMQAANAFVLMNPVFTGFRTTAAEARSGFITFSLDKDFLHAAYREEYVAHMMKYSNGEEETLIVLSDPYTPVIQSISLSYKAHSDEVNLASTSLEDFSNLDVQFFHIAYFGQMREHSYQRNQFSFIADKSVPLLPAYDNEGELLVGLTGLTAGDSVSVLFQVAEGSSDPDLAQEDITWSVLCDNYWQPLGTDGVVLDTTNQLLASGIIKFVIPTQAMTQNTILPADRIWLRAGIAANVTAVCQLIDVAANAVEVEFTDQGNDLTHLGTALAAGTITKLKNGLSAVKAVKQPYASFGGSPEEVDNNFYRRVSERLRHKDRCITPWDYERIILEAFPKVHKVKCIPHAKEGSWLAPGNVLIVVVSDLKNKNALDPLQPKVDADTISRITELVQGRTGMQVQVKVKNPSYQRIQLDFKVKFRIGYEFNFYSEELKQQLIEFLSPWAFESDRDISFGGKIYKSVLLDFVEEIESVDYVTDFKMYSYTEGAPKVDTNEAQPETPDAILVSDDTHVVNEAT
jgi:uncharacterized phage protein gp47/JayE